MKVRFKTNLKNQVAFVPGGGTMLSSDGNV